MKFEPFTENIIFYDGEFSSLDPYVGELLSIGLVKISGEELYLEIEYSGEYSPWTKEHLFPTLRALKVSRLEAKKKITDFVGEEKSYLLSYINDYDVIYLKKLLSEGSAAFNFQPFHWLPLDFASILFGLGYNPEIYMQDDYTKLATELGIAYSNGHTHNALDDALFLRDIYLKLITNN